MWVWQSQAPAGTSKFTGVAGWAALEKAFRICIVAPAARAPITNSRRVGMISPLGPRHCRPGRRLRLARELRQERRIDQILLGIVPIDEHRDVLALDVIRGIEPEVRAPKDVQLCRCRILPLAHDTEWVGAVH